MVIVMGFMQQAMPAFQKRSALDVVLSQRVGNIPFLSIMTLWSTSNTNLWGIILCIIHSHPSGIKLSQNILIRVDLLIHSQSITKLQLGQGTLNLLVNLVSRGIFEDILTSLNSSRV